MAPSKQLWTGDMYVRLKRATTFLLWGFIVFILGQTYALMRGGYYSPGYVFLPLFADVLCFIGLFRMRSVFSDLVNATDSATKESPARVAELESPAPKATVRTASLGAAESEWERLGTVAGRKTVAKTVKKQPERHMPKVDWDEWVGKKLLQKAGILIVLIGMIVFLKYSFDNKWIEELGRIFLSAIAGAALLIAGEYFHKKYAKWSQAFTGGGLALLYLTVWVAHVLYAPVLEAKYGLVIPASMALVLYSAITVIGALAAVRYNARTVAWFTVLGGYLTPLLIDASGSNQLMLILYLAILAGGLLMLAMHKKWQYLESSAFVLTQLYLFGMVYDASKDMLSDSGQAITAAGFFALFTLLPVVRHFRQKHLATLEDIILIVANGAAVFLAVVDALGGWSSGYVGLTCLALAAVYLLFSAFSLKGRREDSVLVNTYLVGTVILIAGALFAELKAEWVTVGWAPFSLLLVSISVYLQRRGPWVCAVVLLFGSLLFLVVNVPLAPGPEALWHPFTSDWAIQSYVVFASLIGWIALAKKLPQTLVNADNRAWMINLLHMAVAGVLFLGVTFEATRLDFTIDLVWTFAYIAFALVAIAVFFFTENIVWFVAAFVVQILALLFMYLFGDHSGMAFFVDDAVRPFLHPWSYLSIMALLASFVMIYVAQIKRGKFVSGMRADVLLIIVAAAQVWVHGSVEITNLHEAYKWSFLFADRVLVGWWILFALAALAFGIYKKHEKIGMAGIALLLIPFVHTHLAILDGQDRFPETILWTLLGLGVCIIGSRMKWKNVLWGGMLLIALTGCIDMLRHLGVQQTGLIRSIWWAIAGLLTMIVGFMEREQVVRRLSMLIFGATVLKLLLVDFSVLETPVRIAASIGTGLLLIGASYLYQRFDSSLLKQVPSK